MHRLLAILLLLLSCAAVQAGEAITIGQSHTLPSKVLQETRNFRVSLPRSYAWAAERRYPVLYVLDAQSRFAHTAVSVDQLAANGDMPETIVVGVDSTVRIRDFTPTDWENWVGGGGAANFKRFLSSELIPTIERDYRTAPFRSVSGHSLSGLFVLYSLSAEPALFQAYIALSPTLDWDNRLPRRLLQQTFTAAPGMQGFLYLARSDDAGQALADFDGVVDTLKQSAPAGLRWQVQAFPDETHSGVPLLAQIDALRKLYAGYHFHRDWLPKGLAFAEQHFQQVSRKLGTPLVLPEDVLNGLGYEALNNGKLEQALQLFERNVKAYPSSANALDSLAEAYAKAGRRTAALRSAAQALELATRQQLPEQDYYARQYNKLQQASKPAGND